MSTKPIHKTVFAAIRKNEVREWIDITTIDNLIECCEEKVVEMRLKIPGWDKANPVVRYVTIEISETDIVKEV